MPRKGESKTSQRRIEARINAAKALEYRKGGLTYARIAELVPYNSVKAAEKAVKSAMDRITEEPAKQVLQLELERLDAILTTIWSQIAKGHLGAIDRAIKVMERRARYLGLDAPVKHDHLVDGSIEIVITTPETEKIELEIHENGNANKS